MFVDNEVNECVKEKTTEERERENESVKRGKKEDIQK